MKILITGVAGSGKTTIIKKLSETGFCAFDLDDIGVCAWINKETGEQTSYKEGAGKEWINNHRWVVLIPKLLDFIENLKCEGNVYFGGKITKSQIGEMTKIFDFMYLLKPNNEIIDSRLFERKSNKNNFGRLKEEREVIIKNRNEFEDKCLSVGAIIINNNGSVDDAIGEINTNLSTS